MPIQIVRNDITKMKVDAVVEISRESFSGGATITDGGGLPCRYIIHTAVPDFPAGTHGERDKLISCYRNSLTLAKEKSCETVAFPLISSGLCGYPKDQALRAAVGAISEFLAVNDMTVYLVIFGKELYQMNRKLYEKIAGYIDDNFVDELAPDVSNRLSRYLLSEEEPCMEPAKVAEPLPMMAIQPAGLKDALNQIDESFTEMLLRKIDEKGMKDSECYRKANIDRRLFSKIRSNKQYKPSKPTVFAFAVALELPLSETKELLMKAGFALSHSNKFDIIVEYFIEQGNYNIFEINEALFTFDQSLLGE